MKIAHLHLKDGFGNTSTLICELVDGSIKYRHFKGLNSSGLSLSLSNLQCNLPLEKVKEGETVEEFRNRLVEVVNTRSVEKVFHVVPNEVKF